MTNKEYKNMANKMAPKSNLLLNCINAFWVGGLICCLGQLLTNCYSSLGLDKTDSSTVTSMSLVFLAVVLTGFAVYDNIAKFAGAGTLVPITGFANSIASPAIEYKTEGMITGLAVKMFTIAGPVLVYGISASVLYGFIYWLCTK